MGDIGHVVDKEIPVARRPVGGMAVPGEVRDNDAVPGQVRRQGNETGCIVPPTVERQHGLAVRVTEAKGSEMAARAIELNGCVHRESVSGLRHPDTGLMDWTADQPDGQITPFIGRKSGLPGLYCGTN